MLVNETIGVGLFHFKTNQRTSILISTEEQTRFSNTPIKPL